MLFGDEELIYEDKQYVRALEDLKVGSCHQLTNCHTGQHRPMNL